MAATTAQLAQSLVAIGSDLHYVAGQPGQGSRALYAGLVVVVVALYALLAPFLTIIVRPRWLNGSGVEPSCAVLVARVFSATARFVLRTPQVSAVAVSKWLANSILAASVLALVAASLAGFPVPPGAALAALLAWVLMVRVTGRLQVGMAATALDEALTRDVANTVMGRALRPDAANPRSVASPLGNSLPQQPEGASPLHSAHPAVHPAPASTVGSAALGSWHAAVGESESLLTTVWGKSRGTLFEHHLLLNRTATECFRVPSPQPGSRRWRRTSRRCPTCASARP